MSLAARPRLATIRLPNAKAADTAMTTAAITPEGCVARRAGVIAAGAQPQFPLPGKAHDDGRRLAMVDCCCRRDSYSGPRPAAVRAGTPKSKASARTLPMPDEVVDVLRATRKRQTEERLAFGIGYGSGQYLASDPAASTDCGERGVAGARERRVHAVRVGPLPGRRAEGRRR